MSTTLLTREYRVTICVSQPASQDQKDTHDSRHEHAPGLSQQSVHPSRKLKESIEAEYKKLYQDHTVPAISASESSAVHDFGSRAEFFILQRLVTHSISI